MANRTSLSELADRALPRLFLVVCCVALLSLTAAQELPQWMPQGGQQLLGEVLEKCGECDDLAALSESDRSREEWRSYLTERGVLDYMDDQQLATLSAYLEIHFPSDSVTSGALPEDGSVMVLNTCSACHIPTPALVGDRSEQEWMAHMTTNHESQLSSFDYSEAELREMAAYLAINMPLPEEVIPEGLLRGFQQY